MYVKKRFLLIFNKLTKLCENVEELWGENPNSSESTAQKQRITIKGD